MRNQLLGKDRVWLPMVGLLLVAWSCTAPAFVEDICPGEDGWEDCGMNPCDIENEALACGTIAMLTGVKGPGSGGPGERSTLHFDATYLLAQAVGFTPRDAFFLAAYDQATDSGRHVHRDQRAQAPIDPALCAGAEAPPVCRLNSLSIEGVTRNNFIEGGLFFHFMASPEHVEAAEGLAPRVTSETREPFLYALRRWVYGEAPLCVAGLLGADGKDCFESPSRERASLVGRIPIVKNTGILTSIDWVADIGEQKVVTDPAAGSNTPASAMKDFLSPADLPLARLGIYLHALGDRISHHRCVDVSTMTGPRTGIARPLVLSPIGDLAYQTLLHVSELPQYLMALSITPLLHNPDYLFEFNRSECDQLDHFVRHTWETGHDRHALAFENRTAEHGLLAVLDELIRFADHHRMPGAKALSQTERRALVNTVLDAIDVPGAQARVDALTALAQAQGWLPLPLHGDLEYEAWTARAGQPFFAKAAVEDESGDAGRSGGGAMGLGLLLLLSAALAARLGLHARR